MILRFEQVPLSRIAEQRILVFPVFAVVNRHPRSATTAAQEAREEMRRPPLHVAGQIALLGLQSVSLLPNGLLDDA